MKRIIEKAMEQVAEELTEMAQGIPNLRREMGNLQLTLLKQDNRLKEIQTLLERITNMQRKEEIKLESMVD